MKDQRRGDRIRRYRAYGGVLIVPAILNQKRRGYLMVDSGAAYCCITPRMAGLLGYELHRPTARRPIFGAQGLVAEVPSFQLASLQVEGIVVEGLEVLVVSFSPLVKIHGVIGVNFLERFRPTLEFDTATLVLRVRSR